MFAAYSDNLLKGMLQLRLKQTPLYILLEVGKSNFCSVEGEVLENRGNLAS